MRVTAGATFSLITALVLAASFPIIDGRITGSWGADFGLYTLALFVIGLLTGLLCPHPLWLPAAAAFVGQVAAWKFFVPANPLWMVGLIVGLILTAVATGGGTLVAQKLIQSSPKHNSGT